MFRYAENFRYFLRNEFDLFLIILYQYSLTLKTDKVDLLLIIWKMFAKKNISIKLEAERDTTLNKSVFKI